ncbi:helix-turn-helix domain-containing protein [Saccharothrix sp. S26]|uniref:helix-turn-helix domain-containing protein n=1 Tax=Saccharothrix sp. S26 TaxID=2907215 RepID=UPI001F1D6752|nr:helix-turn-helix transcriptional regulator [Saccharothrix sp. S26]MCE7000379.1 helix-turn-helix domain-containing protein [Saccharothrix sp. S26]
MTTSGQSPTDYRARLAERLKELMRRSGKDRADIMRTLGCSVSKVGTILRGDTSVPPLELAALLDLFGVEGEERADLLHLGEEARRRRPKTPWGAAIPDRLRKFFNTEETARTIESYRPDLLHGLVQTEDYARAVIRTNSALRPTEVDRLVQARMARQARMTGPNPPEFTMVITQAVLRAPVGSPETRFGQLQHLKKLSRMPHITIRVIPDEVGLTGALYFPFSILTPSGGRAKTVYVETLTDGLLVDEESRISHYEAVFRELVAVSVTDLLDSVEV